MFVVVFVSYHNNYKDKLIGALYEAIFSYIFFISFPGYLFTGS